MPEQDNLSIEHLFSLAGKTALITGGSSGIGFMMAKGLLAAGAKVYISSRKKEQCQQAVVELSESGECTAIPADISTVDGRDHLISALQEQESALDILINNAGASWGASYESYPVSAFEKLLNLNVTSVFALTRDLTPMLAINAKPFEPSRVINLGSIDGLHIPSAHQTGIFAYSASKAAVHQLTKHLAVELGPQQITVNAVAPGLFPTKMTKFLLDNYQENFEKNSLLGRLGQAEEMAGIAIYLCSRAGAYTNGAIIPVDGGTIVNQQHVREQ
jgi:NAD(P)-dependent dehydrogenase (short-subunit alcohol dehydrogenase family)